MSSDARQPRVIVKPEPRMSDDEIDALADRMYDGLVAQRDDHQRRLGAARSADEQDAPNRPGSWSTDG